MASNKIYKQIDSLKDEIIKEGTPILGFDLTFKKENIEFEAKGTNQEVTYSLLPDPLENQFVSPSHHATKETQLFSHKVDCPPASNIFVSGNDRTGSEGQYLLRIRSKICQTFYTIDQLNFVATPVGKAPAVLNFNFNRQDETITIFAFDLQGAPIPNLRFHWHLMLNHVIISDPVE